MAYRKLLAWDNPAPWTWLTVILIFVPRLGSARDDAPQQPRDDAPQQHGLVFEADVVPILVAYCWECHGSSGRKANLDLRTLPLVLQGGKSGPAIVIGSAEKSLLFEKLQSKQMPPGKALRPTDRHVETIRQWIDSGANATYNGGPSDETADPPLTDDDRDWWSFRSPEHPSTPSVRSPSRVRSAIDAFVLARLEKRDLTLNVDADPVTLVRRVFLDLTGLPPTPSQVAHYLSDQSPDRHERLVDRVLASPDYGPRWARHWLDAAGYVDVRGTDSDHGTINLLDGIWRYRDYVIESFDNDLPYDQFLTQQIAGDELVDWRNAQTYDDSVRRSLIATGFLRLAADKTSKAVGKLDRAPIRHQVINDTLANLGTNLLGLTLQCAQCHSHKFDPISHVDYYRFRALITPAFNRQSWINSSDRHLHVIPEDQSKKFDARNAKIDEEIKELSKSISDLRADFRDRVRSKKLEQLPEPIRADTEKSLATPAKNRTSIEKYLAGKLGPLLEVTDPEIDSALDEQALGVIDGTKSQIDALKAERHDPGKIQALWDVGPPPTQYLLRRGDFQTPGAIVFPGIISVLDSPDTPFQVTVPKPAQLTSGYRSALARWLTHPDHPLTTRVFVNRVWQHYFDRGIVETVDNLGRGGALPSHPRLLDWLANELVRSGWRLKHLHRQILTSTTYRQTSRSSPDPALERRSRMVDPENRLLWRMPLRRLESEAIRDSVLTVSGTLDRTFGGPPVLVKAVDGGGVEIDAEKLATPTSEFRRTIYVVSRRNYHMAELRVFDQPSLATNCTQRNNSAVVLQSLTFLNGSFVQRQSGHFADRVKRSVGDDELARIDRSFRLALCRGPSTEEIALGRDLLAKQIGLYRQADPVLTPKAAADLALRDLCQMLLNTSGFLYIE